MNENPDFRSHSRPGGKPLANPLLQADSAATEAAPQPSFYSHIGGATAVREAVDRLYQLILTDPELLPYFEGKDLPQLKSHMAALLTKVLGGPDGYGGRDLAEAHRGLGITEAHFYKVADYLITVLLNMGVDNNVVAAVSLTLAGVKDQIVERYEQDGVAATGEGATPGTNGTAGNPPVPGDAMEQHTPGEEHDVASSMTEPTPGTPKGA